MKQIVITVGTTTDAQFTILRGIFGKACYGHLDAMPSKGWPRMAGNACVVYTGLCVSAMATLGQFATAHCVDIGFMCDGGIVWL